MVIFIINKSLNYLVKKIKKKLSLLLFVFFFFYLKSCPSKVHILIVELKSITIGPTLSFAVCLYLYIHRQETNKKKQFIEYISQQGLQSVVVEQRWLVGKRVKRKFSHPSSSQEWVWLAFLQLSGLQSTVYTSDKTHTHTQLEIRLQYVVVLSLRGVPCNDRLGTQSE